MLEVNEGNIDGETDRAIGQIVLQSIIGKSGEREESVVNELMRTRRLWTAITAMAATTSSVISLMELKPRARKDTDYRGQITRDLVLHHHLDTE